MNVFQDISEVGKTHEVILSARCFVFYLHLIAPVQHTFWTVKIKRL